MQEPTYEEQNNKARLAEELETMRHRVAELEALLAKSDAKPHRPENFVARSPRIEIHTDIEFIADFDIVDARGVNISETGICFELSESLPFEIQFRIEGKVNRIRAHLVWAKRLPDGGYRFGLEFVEPEPEPEF